MILTATICVGAGCRAPAPVRHPPRAAAHPAVVALIDENTGGEAPMLIGSGVPRPGGRVITALHVVAKGFPVPAGNCGPVREIAGFHPHHLSHSEPDAGDIVWIDTSCLFDRTDQITTIPPPIGTRVTLAGYPGAIFSGEDFASGSIPPPCVLEGVVIEEPVGLTSPDSGVIWVEIDGVWSGFMPGLSGGPCAYQDDAGRLVVFGVAQLRLGDEVWELLGINLPIHAGKRHAIVAVAPIPEEWEE